LLALTDAH